MLHDSKIINYASPILKRSDSSVCIDKDTNSLLDDFLGLNKYGVENLHSEVHEKGMDKNENDISLGNNSNTISGTYSSSYKTEDGYNSNDTSKEHYQCKLNEQKRLQEKLAIGCRKLRNELVHVNGKTQKNHGKRVHCDNNISYRDTPDKLCDNEKLVQFYQSDVKVKNLMSKVVCQRAEIERLRSENKSLKTRIELQDISFNISEQDNMIEKLQEQVKELETMTDVDSSTQKTLKETIIQLRSEVSLLKTQLNNTNILLDNEKKKVNGLEHNLESLNEERTSLIENIFSINTQLETERSINSRLQLAYQTLLSKINTKDAEIRSIFTNFDNKFTVAFMSFTSSIEGIISKLRVLENYRNFKRERKNKAEKLKEVNEELLVTRNEDERLKESQQVTTNQMNELLFRVNYINENLDRIRKESINLRKEDREAKHFNHGMLLVDDLPVIDNTDIHRIEDKKLKSFIEKIMNENVRLKEHLETLEHDLINARDGSMSFENKSSELADVNHDFEELYSKYRILEVDNQCLKRSCDSLLEEKRNLSIKNTKQLEELEKKSNEIKTLKEKNQELLSNHLNNGKLSTSVIERLEIEYMELKHLYETTAKENRNLSMEIMRLEHQIIKLKDELDKLDTNANTSTESQQRKMSIDMQAENEEIRLIKSENYNLKLEISSINSQNRDLSIQLQMLKNEIDFHKKEINILREKNNNLVWESIGKENDDISKDNEIYLVRTGNNGLIKEHDNYCRRTKEMEEESRIAKYESLELRKSSAELTQINNSLANQSELDINKMESHKNENLEISNHSQELMTQINILKIDTEQQSNKIASLKDQLTSVNQKLSSSIGEIEIFKMEMESINDDTDDILIDRIESLELENSNLSEKVQMLLDRESKLIEEKERLKNELDSINKNSVLIEGEGSTSRKARKMLETENEKLTKEILALKCAIREQCINEDERGIITKIENENTQLLKKNEELYKAIGDAQHALESVQKELTNVCNERDILKDQLSKPDGAHKEEEESKKVYLKKALTKFFSQDLDSQEKLIPVILNVLGVDQMKIDNAVSKWRMNCKEKIISLG